MKKRVKGGKKEKKEKLEGGKNQEYDCIRKKEKI